MPCQVILPLEGCVRLQNPEIHLASLETWLLESKTVFLQASELADLEDEANMPLEQLLARYRHANNPEPGPSHTPPSPPPTAPQPPALNDPSPTQTANNSQLSTVGSSQQTEQVQAGSIDKGKRVASLHGQPPPATPGTSEGPPSPAPGVSEAPSSATPGVSGGPPSASIGMTETGNIEGEGVANVKPDEQAEQATAAGMDAFEHSQALAERRASGSQAGPSALTPPAPGKQQAQAHCHCAAA